MSKKYTFIVLLLLSMFFTSVSLFSQSFVKTIGNQEHLINPSIEKYGKNSIIVSTVTKVPGINKGQTKLFVQMLTGNGSSIWSNKINFTGAIQVTAGAVTIDFNYDGEGTELIVITGSVLHSEMGNDYRSVFIVRLNPIDGSIIDYKLLRGENNQAIYGFDVESTKGGYIIVGSAIQEFSDNVQNSSKLALVLGVDKNLDPIWAKNYKSSGTSNMFNSFNYVVKAENYPYHDDVYLISGTGTSINDDLPMVIADLVTDSGVSLWNGVSYEYDEGTGNRFFYDTYANRVLYNSITNEFNLLTREVENWVNILVLDGLTGSKVSSKEVRVGTNYEHEQHKFCCETLQLVNGMDWYSMDNNQILLSGNILYRDVNPFTNPDVVHQFLNLIDLDILDNNENKGIVFNSINSKNALMNIDFDYMTKPISYNDGMLRLYQYFYETKSLYFDEDNNVIKFTGMILKDGIQKINLYAISNADLTSSNSCKVSTDVYSLATHSPLVRTYHVVTSDHIVEKVYDVFIESSNIVVNINDYCCVTCKITKELGVEDNRHLVYNSDIEIYPNPASINIEVSGLPKCCEIEIELFDMNGRRVLSSVVEKNVEKTQIDVSVLQGGTYFLKLQDLKTGKIRLIEKLLITNH